MSYTDLRDFACEYERRRDDLTVRVEKLGGGTVGKTYNGDWRYIVLRDGEEIARARTTPPTRTSPTHRPPAT